MEIQEKHPAESDLLVATIYYGLLQDWEERKQKTGTSAVRQTDMLVTKEEEADKPTQNP